jgi:ABC-type branched-subunit amino acid transport system substrate-binding protein
MVIPPLSNWFPRPPRLRWWLFLSVALLSCRAPEALIPPPPPQVIKIGLVAPFEGRYRYIGYDAIYAARLAVREINAQGGVAGRRLELVAYDDRSNSQLAARAAYNLTVDPDVLAVVGHYRYTSTLVALPIYAEVGLPQVVVGGWGAALPSTLCLMPEADRLAQAMVSVGLSGLPAERSASITVWTDGEYATQPADPPLVEALHRVGEANAMTVAPARGDLVLTSLPPIGTAERLVSLRAAGWAGGIVGVGDLAAADFATLAGSAAIDAQFVTSYPFPRDLTGTEAWIAAYRAVGPHVPDPGPYALPTYEAIGLIAEALDALLSEGAELDRSALRDALGDVQHRSRLGMMQFDAQGAWQDASLYHYRWEPDGPELLGTLP